MDINEEIIVCSECIKGFWLTFNGKCMQSVRTECIEWE